MPQATAQITAPPQPLVALSEDEILFRDNVRQFAEDSIRPKVREMDEKGVLRYLNISAEAAEGFLNPFLR
jgi:hypothetical protein